MKSKQYLDLTVLLLILLYAALPVCSEAGFTETPSSQEVFAGEAAVFRCSHPAAFAIGWNVNGTVVGQNSSTDITLGNERDDDGAFVHILTIIAHPQYNGTEVVCVAVFIDGSQPQSSPPVILLVSLNASLATPGFSIMPANLTVAEGLEAVFHCQHPTADTIGWRLNGTTFLDSALDTVFASTTSTAGGIVNILTILALPLYNKTQVECVAVYFDNTPRMDSGVVNLMIQGSLSAVGNLHRISDTIAWNPPFSLNLTDVDPDIVYCVEVYNITCESRDLIISDCNLTIPNYTSNALLKGFLYDINVTPRSYVTTALNGTLSTVSEQFVRLVSPEKIGFEIRDDLVSVNISRTKDNLDKVLPSSYSLLLRSVDGVNDSDLTSPFPTKVVVQSGNELTLNVLLPRRRVWEYQILPYECFSDSSDETVAVLSTHDIQSLGVKILSNPGEVQVTGRFISHEATGVLIIIYSTSASGSIFYHIAQRTSDQLATVISNLPQNEYRMSVFVVVDNDMPFNRSATVPLPVTVLKGSKPVEPLEYELVPDMNGLNVICKFQEDSHYQSCVVIVHPHIEMDRLMTIQSYSFTRDGNTAFGFIEGVNLNDYQFGVVGGRIEDPGQMSDSVGSAPSIVIAIAFLTFILVLLAIVVVMVIVIMAKKYKKSDDHFHQDVEENPYSSLPTTDSAKSPPASPTEVVTSLSVNNDEPIYDEAARVESTASATEDEDKSTNLKYASVELSTCKSLTQKKPDDLYKTEQPYSVLRHQEKGLSTVTSSHAKDKEPTLHSPMPVTVDNLYDQLWPLHSKWKALGSAMSLSEDRLDEIFTNNEKDECCFRQVLEYYMCNCDKQHNWKEIVSLLKGLEAKELADKIDTLHVYPYDESFPGQVPMLQPENCGTEISISFQAEPDGESLITVIAKNEGSVLFRSNINSPLTSQTFLASSSLQDDNLDAKQSPTKENHTDLSAGNQTGSEIATGLNPTESCLLTSAEDHNSESCVHIVMDPSTMEKQACSEIVTGLNPTDSYLLTSVEDHDREGRVQIVVEPRNMENHQKDFVSCYGPTKEKCQDDLVDNTKLLTPDTSSVQTYLQRLIPSLRDSDKLRTVFGKTSSCAHYFLPHSQIDSEEVEENLPIDNSNEIEKPMNVQVDGIVDHGHLVVSEPDINSACPPKDDLSVIPTQSSDCPDIVQQDPSVDSLMLATLDTGQIPRRDYGELECSTSQPTVKMKRECDSHKEYPLPVVHLEECVKEKTASDGTHHFRKPPKDPDIPKRTIFQMKLTNSGSHSPNVNSFRIWWVQTLLLLFAAANVTVGQSESRFTEVPKAVVQAAGATAVFSCAHSSAEVVSWQINDLAPSEYGASSSCIWSNGTSLCLLRVPAEESSNNTWIKCVALPYESTPVQLIVQGRLSKVRELRIVHGSGTIDVVFQPPFSLNLSHADPDIRYCIDVYNITNGDQSHIISDCSVTDPFYNFTLEHPRQIEQLLIRVTPQSNVDHAKNGTLSEINETYFYAPVHIHNESIDIRVQERTGNMSNDSTTTGVGIGKVSNDSIAIAVGIGVLTVLAAASICIFIICMCTKHGKTLRKRFLPSWLHNIDTSYHGESMEMSTNNTEGLRADTISKQSEQQSSTPVPPSETPSISLSDEQGDSSRLQLLNESENSTDLPSGTEEDKVNTDNLVASPQIDNEGLPQESTTKDDNVACDRVYVANQETFFLPANRSCTSHNFISSNGADVLNVQDNKDTEVYAEADKNEDESFVTSAQTSGNDEAKGDTGTRFKDSQRSRRALSEPHCQAHRDEEKYAGEPPSSSSASQFLSDDEPFSNEIKTWTELTEGSCDSTLTK